MSVFVHVGLPWQKKETKRERGTAGLWGQEDTTSRLVGSCFFLSPFTTQWTLKSSSRTVATYWMPM